MPTGAGRSNHMIQALVALATRIGQEIKSLADRVTVLERDTGWRDISSLFAGRTAGSVAIRRIGKTVWLRASDFTAEDQGSFSTWQSVIPSGFRVDLLGFVFLPAGPRSASYAAGPVRIHRDGTFLVYGLGVKPLDFHGSWVTDNAWPSTLPGTAL